MALLSNSKTVFINNGTLTFSGGDYTFDFTENKNFIRVELEDGPTTNVTSSQFNAVNKIVIAQDTNVTIDFAKLGAIDIDFQANGGVNLTGISFTSADKAGYFKFEPVQNLDSIVTELLIERGVSGAIDALSINGNKADAFKIVWDYLDDGYSYYNTPVNQAFAELGFKYLDYLNHGGDPILDTIVKYGPDSNNNGTPQRAQTIHDNLLGNLDIASIKDKFFDGNTGNNPDGTTYQGSATSPNEALGNEIIATLTELGWDRPYFGGNEGEVNAARTWEQSHHPEWFI